MIKLIVPPQKGGVHDFSTRVLGVLSKDAPDRVSLYQAAGPDLQISPDDVAILQFSGYGFEKRGAPLWLLREIEHHRKNIRSLGVFFHELYAFGPPWRSSFWLSPVQRHIARRLAELSDFWMTNREESARWLRRFAADKPHAVIPVFSNVGESAALSNERLPKIVVFGGRVLREKTYLAAGDKLFSWAKQASLEVHDIGPPVVHTGISAALHSNRVICHGELDEQAVHDLMSEATYGVVAYAAESAAKSGVFAAYAAHGVCPVLLSTNYGEADDLVAGVHYLSGLPASHQTTEAQRVGLSAWQWYQPHALQVHTSKLLNLMEATASTGTH